jgi:hypothetical protein
MAKTNIRKSSVYKTNAFFNLISKLPNKEMNKILGLTKGDPEILQSLREISKNYLSGNLKKDKKINQKDINFMKNLIKEENKPERCSCKKRTKLVQKGGKFIRSFIQEINSKIDKSK